MVKLPDGVEAVVLDLDDTLVPQGPWLAAAAVNLGRRIEQLGLAPKDQAVAAALQVLAESSTSGRVVNEVLDRLEVEEGSWVGELVEAFMSTRPEHLPTYPGAKSLLLALKHAGISVGVLTDGRVEVQNQKLKAAGLSHLVDACLVTDSLGGRACRKPNPVGLETLAGRLGVYEPERLLVIGDRPDKDMAVAAAVGALSWRVLTGEHSCAQGENADRVFDSLWDVGVELEALPFRS